MCTCGVRNSAVACVWDDELLFLHYIQNSSTTTTTCTMSLLIISSGIYSTSGDTQVRVVYNDDEERKQSEIMHSNYMLLRTLFL